MKYKNIKTNNFVETDGVIGGELWELVDGSKKEPSKETEPVKPVEEPKKEPTEETESVEPTEPKRKTRAKAK